MADAIFISYRRDDSEGEAGRLFDDLTRAFGNDAVFMDVAGIKPGVDFRKAIEDNVANCGVFLAVVGPSWAKITGPDGQRRLEQPNDFVALEIVSALKREVPVIPVLVHDAKMPSPDMLPDSLKNFAFHNSVEISHARWSSDVALLVEALKSYVTPKTASEAPVHATVPVQLPAPHPPSSSAAAAKSRLPITLGVIALVLIVVVIGFVVIRPGHDTSTTTPSAAQTTTPTQAAAPTEATAPPVATAAAPSSPTADYEGSWKLASGGGNNDTLTSLIIAKSSDGSLAIHAYGGCQAPVCDWGQQPATLTGANLVATFSPTPSGSDTARTVILTVHPISSGLDVLIQNTFQSPSGTRKNSAHRVFSSAQ